MNSVKTHKTAVVIIPPLDIWPPVQEIRQKHDRNFNRWMPHVSLLYPFYPQNQFSDLHPEFIEVCGKFKKFEVSLEGFEFFTHSSNSFTIWLNLLPRQPVIQLQDVLWQLVPECDDVRRFETGFTPHLSLGQVRGREYLEKLQLDFKKRWRAKIFIISEIFFISRESPPRDIFQVTHSISLG